MADASTTRIIAVFADHFGGFARRLYARRLRPSRTKSLIDRRGGSADFEDGQKFPLQRAVIARRALLQSLREFVRHVLDGQGDGHPPIPWQRYGANMDTSTTRWQPQCRRV